MNKITIGQLKEAAFKFNCATWRNHIYDILKENIFKKDEEEIEIDEKYLNLLRKTRNSEMFDYVEKELNIKVDRSVFIKEFVRDYLSDFSNSLFGNTHYIEIASNSAKRINRPDLVGRAFYISHELEVILHPIERCGDGTVIELKRK